MTADGYRLRVFGGMEWPSAEVSMRTLGGS